MGNFVAMSDPVSTLLNILSSQSLPEDTASKARATRIVEELSNQVLDSVKDPWERGLLHLACMNQWHYALIRRLVESNGCSVKNRDWKGRTPVHYACESLPVEYVKYLVERGCDPSCEDINRETPLHFACRKARKLVVDYLVKEKHCNVHKRSNFGETPLGLLVVSHFISPEETGTDEDKAHNLISCLPNPAEVKVDNGWSLLHFACLNNWQSVVKTLIEDHNCNPQCHDEWGDSPLHFACQRGSTDLVRYLIDQHGCDPMCQGEILNTPLHYASSAGNLDTVRYLVKEKNCSPLCPNKYGNTPVVVAQQSGRKEVLTFLNQHATVFAKTDHLI